MNGKTNGNRGPRRAGTAAVVAAIAMLATACGGITPSLGSLSLDNSALGRQALPALQRFAQCMHSHGVPDFPDPQPSGRAAPASAKDAGLDSASPRFQAALRACRHVLPAGVHISIQKHVSVGANG